MFKLGVFYATDRNGVGSVNAFDIHGVFGKVKAIGIGRAVFFLAPETNALAELAEGAIVETVTGRECEKSQSVGAGLLPDTFTAQFRTV